jgi:hypothetical protein
MRDDADPPEIAQIIGESLGGAHHEHEVARHPQSRRDLRYYRWCEGPLHQHEIHHHLHTHQVHISKRASDEVGVCMCVRVCVCAIYVCIYEGIYLGEAAVDNAQVVGKSSDDGVIQVLVYIHNLDPLCQLVGLDIRDRF